MTDQVESPHLLSSVCLYNICVCAHLVRTSDPALVLVVSDRLTVRRISAIQSPAFKDLMTYSLTSEQERSESSVSFKENRALQFP